MTNQDMNDDDGVVDGEILEPIDSGAMVKIARTEIDAQIATAKAFPRNVAKLRQDLLALVTIDEETAEECIYALPRGKNPDGSGKFIKGPSARFADALILYWGNARSGAYVTDVNRELGYVEAIGSFQDVERNVIRQRRVRRGITGRHGLYNADMINMTGNAACVIAERNAILNGVPKSLWGPVYDRAFALVAGGTQSLGDKIGRAKKAFMAMGISFELVLERLGYGTDESRITPEDVVTLRGMLTALKTGEENPESLFGRGATGANHERVHNPMKDEQPASNDRISTGNVQRQAASSQNGRGPNPEQTESSGSVRGNQQSLDGANTVIEENGRISKYRDPDAIIAPVVDKRFVQEDQNFATLAEWSEAVKAADMERPIFPGDEGTTSASTTKTAIGSTGPAEHDADGVVHDSGSPAGDAQGSSASPANGGSKPSAPEKPYTDGSSYDAWARDQIDNATSKAGVTEVWGATRADRNELLSPEQIDSLTKYKEAKLQKLKAKGGAS